MNAIKEATRRCTAGKRGTGASKKKPAGSSRERIGTEGRRLSHVASGYEIWLEGRATNLLARPSHCPAPLTVVRDPGKSLPRKVLVSAHTNERPSSGILGSSHAPSNNPTL
jgi:hypothetical protein